MLNFRYKNPVEIVFGKGMIAKLPELIPAGATILMTYGGGSIKKNGVYEQVQKALQGRKYFEFGGIEPNPEYETLMKAVEIVKKEKVDFLLAVGGGSVLDGTKFIAAAAVFEGPEPWDIADKGAEIKNILPIGSVITLPATGSEQNSWTVVSRRATDQKILVANPKFFPQFAIIDPETNFTLPMIQVSNGIVDTFVHVAEQYMTYPVNTPLQDRQAEAIFAVLLEEGPKVFKDPKNYDIRANLCWAATWGLNGWINCGVVQDWSTHLIGHEITALTDADHGKTLALVLPAVWQHQRKEKADKLVQFGRHVLGLTVNAGETPAVQSEKMIDLVIAKTKEFFRAVGIDATKKAYGVTDEICKKIAKKLGAAGKLGEHQNLGEKEILEILQLCD